MIFLLFLSSFLFFLPSFLMLNYLCSYKTVVAVIFVLLMISLIQRINVAHPMLVTYLYAPLYISVCVFQFNSLWSSNHFKATVYLFPSCFKRWCPGLADNLVQWKAQKVLESHRQGLCLELNLVLVAPEQALSSLSSSFTFHTTRVITATSESCQKMNTSNLMYNTVNAERMLIPWTSVPLFVPPYSALGEID